MDVREKLIEICFREFCDLAGDSPCGCDGCPYGEYEPDNGGCYVEYKKDKIENLENDMDKYQKEDNGVTVQDQDGCDYCQLFDDPCGIPMIAQEESESDRGIYLYNGFLCANGGEFCEARVNFCPMCGRRFPQPPKGE